MAMVKMREHCDRRSYMGEVLILQMGGRSGTPHIKPDSLLHTGHLVDNRHT